MKIKHIFITMITGLMIFSTIYLGAQSDMDTVRAQIVPVNRPPILVDPGMWMSGNDVVFAVTYKDQDGDKGGVTVFVDGEPIELVTYENDAIGGLYYENILPAVDVNDYTEFYFTAHDDNGSEITLYDEYGDPFLVGDFDGWGEYPVLSNPDVYFDEDDNEWVFNVTYRDPDGDEASSVALNIDDEWWGQMTTWDDDPLYGQVYYAYLEESEVDQFTKFYFDANDVNGSYAELYDEDWNAFLVGPFLESDGNGGGNGDGGDGGGGISFGFPAGWDDPEVIVGLVALVGMAGAGGYGLYRKKKKRGRFSELLTQLDDIYKSFKTNPHKCEIELEKVRGTINEDLKSSVIDENNYNILKDRIDEIMQDIRSESLLAEVRDMPKDIEIRIKDMLIDGKITRAEYDKLLPIIKGSDMASQDKEKMEKTLESWVEKDKKINK